MKDLRWSVWCLEVASNSCRYLYSIATFLFFVGCRDAEDAVSKRDGYDYDGYRLRVEFPRGGTRGGGGRDGGGRRSGGGQSGGDRGRGAPARRSQYRVIVSGTHLLSYFFIRMLSVGCEWFARAAVMLLVLNRCARSIICTLTICNEEEKGGGGGGGEFGIG